MRLPLVLVALTIAVASAQLATAEPIIFLARHAEKSDAPRGDAKNPELSAQGRARAALLGRMLKDAGIGAVFATEYARTQQTAEEISRTTGARVSVVPAKDAAALLDQLRTLESNAVVVGHSNTIPELIKGLGVEKPITIAESDYDNLFLWRRSAPRELLQLHY
ncbi:MAG TPA: phosphoglycerate mutase family protein [Chthoniobacterales bacterium]|nr:phosphoglycerate mutase family protein [Chthoniobacterales bacterium]